MEHGVLREERAKRLSFIEEGYCGMDILADLVVVALFVLFFVGCWGLVKFLDRI